MTAATSRAMNVLVVDDHPIVRHGLARLISQEPGLAACGEAADPHQAIECIETTRPDLVIVDISLGSTSGLALVEDIAARRPDLPVLVLSMHDEALYAERALRAGARGYIMKQAPPDEIIAAIRKTLQGEVYLSHTMANRVMHGLVGAARTEPATPLDRLTNRELEVFDLIAQGLSTSRIAHSLHRSVKTIETHVAHIREKLGLRDSRELLRYAIEWSRRSATP